MRARDIAAVDRLTAQVDIEPDGCWPWRGKTTPDGYGVCGYRGQRHVLAHRAVFTEFVSPIADGLTIEHICHSEDFDCPGGRDCPHRRCVNPDHLEELDAVENAMRGRGFSVVNRAKTHCPHGHPYDEANTYVSAGRRYCIECWEQRTGYRPTPRGVSA